jgi:hypothetical protein
MPSIADGTNNKIDLNFTPNCSHLSRSGAFIKVQTLKFSEIAGSAVLNRKILVGETFTTTPHIHYPYRD